MNNDNVLHHFTSKTQANDVMVIVSRQSGNGGKKCFLVDECPVSSRKGRRVYRIRFLSDEYENMLGCGAVRLGAVVIREHVRQMQGFVRGYLYAVNNADKLVNDSFARRAGKNPQR